MVEVEFGCGGPDHHGSRRLVGVAATQAALHRLDRREGHGNRFESRAVRKVRDPGNADSCTKSYFVTGYFVTGWRERLSMM
jgi:hypothetical protein